MRNNLLIVKINECVLKVLYALEILVAIGVVEIERMLHLLEAIATEFGKHQGTRRSIFHSELSHIDMLTVNVTLLAIEPTRSSIVYACGIICFKLDVISVGLVLSPTLVEDRIVDY